MRGRLEGGRVETIDAGWGNDQPDGRLAAEVGRDGGRAIPPGMCQQADIGQRREAIQRAFSARGVGFIRAVANLAQTMMQGWVILERADSIGVNHLDGFYDAAKADIDSDANLTDAFTARHEIFFGAIQPDPTAREKQDYLLTAQMMVNEFAALAALTDALDLALS